jgi:hypothetical protein
MMKEAGLEESTERSFRTLPTEKQYHIFKYLKTGYNKRTMT